MFLYLQTKIFKSSPSWCTSLELSMSMTGEGTGLGRSDEPCNLHKQTAPICSMCRERNKFKFKGLKKDSLNSLPATQDRAFYDDFPPPLPTPPEYSGSICCFQHVVILVTISHVAIFIYLMPHALFPLVLIMERMVILLYHLFPLMQVGQASLLSHKTLAAYLRSQNHLG